MDNKISIDAIRNVLDEHDKNEITVDWYGEELCIKRSLSAAEMMRFVSDAVDACYTSDGEYMPEARAFAERMLTFAYYTNFELPENTAERFAFVYSKIMSTNYDQLMCEIDEEQHDEMIYAISQKIRYRNDVKRQDLENRIMEAADAMNNIADLLSGLVNGVEPGDIQNLIAALGENGIDEEKIVSLIAKEKYGSVQSTEEE
jgi:hypothetical protein